MHFATFRRLFRPAPGAAETPRWMSWALLAAALYNLVWGGWVVLFPHALFDGLQMARPNYPELWQCVGMIVGVYGIGYALAPENTLIPDRAPDSTTPKAAAGWLRTLTSGRRSRPVKNCRTHEDPKNPHLDRIYEMEGWELGVLDDLLMKHDELMNEVLTPAQRRDFEHAMDGALEIFFMDALIRNK